MKYLNELSKAFEGEGTILLKDSWRSYFEKQMNDAQYKDRSESPWNDEYDYGVFIGYTAQGQMGHSGGDPGVSTMMFYDSEKGRGYYFAVNTDLDNKKICT